MCLRPRTFMIPNTPSSSLASGGSSTALGNRHRSLKRMARATEILLIDMPIWMHFWLAAERQIAWGSGNLDNTPGGIAAHAADRGSVQDNLGCRAKLDARHSCALRCGGTAGEGCHPPEGCGRVERFHPKRCLAKIGFCGDVRAFKTEYAAARRIHANAPAPRRRAPQPRGPIVWRSSRLACSSSRLMAASSSV